MELVDPAIQLYSEQHSTSLHPALEELERETYLKVLSPHMISGKLQGLLFYFICKMHRPKKVLEIGTFTGYAAICFALGTDSDAHVHTIERDDELEPMIRKYIDKTGTTSKISLHLGDAKAIIPTLDNGFDLIYIDAGKSDYEFYMDICYEKLNPGGLIIADNVLWKGKVITDDNEKNTKIFKEFNAKVAEDPKFEKILLPIRDGIYLLRKL